VSLTLATFRSVVTKDYLDSIGGADLFCADLIGKKYKVLGAKLRDKKDPESTLLIEVHNGLRSMTWFLNNFLQNALEHDTEVAMLDHVRQDRIPVQFEVKGFEPSSDRYGAPLYSMRVFDFAKIRKQFPDEFAIITDRESEFTERSIANTTIREHADDLFLNRYLDKDGKLTADASKKFRLGIIKIEVTEWVTEE
jgi:hypothetical protein